MSPARHSEFRGGQDIGGLGFGADVPLAISSAAGIASVSVSPVEPMAMAASVSMAASADGVRGDDWEGIVWRSDASEEERRRVRMEGKCPETGDGSSLVPGLQVDREGKHGGAETR